MTIAAAAGIGAVLGALAAPLALAATEAPATAMVRDLDLGGVGQRLLHLTPATPRGVLVMLPGGAGRIGIGRDGILRNGRNFLVRAREAFAAAGYAVIIPDAVKAQGLRGRRSGEAYAGIVAGLVGFARLEAAGPVFLVGTSQGAIAGMNGAAHLGDRIAGLVLTSSVSRRGGSGETVFDTRPEMVTAPVLVLVNRDDACPVSPPGDADKIAAALTHAAGVDVVVLAGGIAAGGDCSARSPHGFNGIEAEAVAVIVRWLDARAPRP